MLLRFLIAGIASFGLIASAGAEVNGIGATFPLPVMKSWIDNYQKVSKTIIRYEGLGSAEGISRITARTVDFAITDIALTQAELSHDDLLQFPLVIGGIVLVVNLPGLESNQLHLTGEVLADIYLGKIKFWDDLAIRSLNPTLNLPNKAITPVHREDGSGSSFTFTSYLSRVSNAWDEKLGIGSKIKWPSGPGAKGNDGVASLVAKATGSIGYVEFLYAQKYKLSMVSLKNKSGVFVQANLNTFSAAAAKANWQSQNYYQVLTNLDGADSWPIVGVSYVLLHGNSQNQSDTQEMLQFFDWVYKNGIPNANRYSYLLIHENSVVDRIQNSWKVIKDANGKSLYPVK
jgi:phosphate transport system substrate-binding protein